MIKVFRSLRRRGSLFTSGKHLLNLGEVVLENRGRCPTCTREVIFVARDPWLRDHYICSSCGSIPRERALMWAIETYFPLWGNLTIHESSPASRGASLRLQRECGHYIPSQFYPGKKLGSYVKGVRCENLEALTFADESIDLHVTQDVMEHIVRPSQAFAEIERTLKPGGAHIFTVPLVNKQNPSKQRAKINEAGEVIHLAPPIYHGNPVSHDGALVTVDWGYDICEYIFAASGLFTLLLYIDDTSKGIRAEYIDVLITIKPSRKGDINVF
jgi:Methyltransferase domain